MTTETTEYILDNSLVVELSTMMNDNIELGKLIDSAAAQHRPSGTIDNDERRVIIEYINNCNDVIRRRPGKASHNIVAKYIVNSVSLKHEMIGDTEFDMDSYEQEWKNISLGIQ